MITLWDVYHQIIQALVGGCSDALVILPKSEINDDIFINAEKIFPVGGLMLKISDDEKILAEIDELDLHQITKILVFPPSKKIKERDDLLRKKYPGYRDIGAIALRNIVQKANPDTKVVAVMPHDFFVSRSDRAVRDEIFAWAPPEALISHPLVWSDIDMRIHPIYRVTTIAMIKDGSPQSPIKFFKGEEPRDDTQAKEIVDDFKKLLKQGGGQTKYGYAIRERGQIEGRWDYEYHHPQVLQRKKELSAFGNTKLIKDVYEVTSGTINKNSHANQLVENPENDDREYVPLLEARDLLPNGMVSEPRLYVVDPDSTLILKRGDIVIRSFHQFNKGNSYPVVMVTENQRFIAAQSLLILRSIVDLSEDEKKFMLTYLRSDTFLRFLSLEGIGVHISSSNISNIPVPIPDENLLIAFRSIDEAQKRFQKWIDDAEQAKNILIKAEPGKNARINILSTGRLARQRLEAGLQIEDFRYLIRTQFPHPLAYSWRVVEATNHDKEGYDEILKAAEITICYLACISMVAISSIPGEKVSYLDSVASNLCDKGHGTSMGDWVSILREIKSLKSVEKNNDTIAFFEIIQLLADKNIDSIVQSLKKKRDDNAHGRGPTLKKELMEAYTQAKQDLEFLYKSVDFLTEYPLRYIETTNRDSIRKRTKYTYRELRGDHPFVPIQSEESFDNELEAGSLYVVDRQKKLFLLRPFLLRKECPTCGHWSTFYLDTFNKSAQNPIIKSMEHGHTSAEPDLYSAFRLVGLLK